MSNKNDEEVEDQTISISSSNLDKTMGIEALNLNVEKKSDTAQSLGFSPPGYSELVEIGKGGMGKIYRAKQDSLGRNVAIKVMHFPDDDEGVKRFMMEASILAQLDHPNIIRVFDFGQSDGMMYLVMELIDGDTLKQHVVQQGPMPVEDFLLIAKQLTGALLESHRQNIVHRDIKPSNILLKIRDDNKISKLIDFGLVKNLTQSMDLSRTGTVLGSPLYMSPEQLLSEDVDDRTDIYAMGLTFYFLLTAKPPYKAKEMLALFRCQLEEDPEKIEHIRMEMKEYPAICWMVETMVKKKKENRFQNAQQLKECIQLIEKMMITGQHHALSIENNVVKVVQKVDRIQETSNESSKLIARSEDPTLSPDQIAYLHGQLLIEEQELSKKRDMSESGTIGQNIQNAENLIENSGSFVHPETSQSLPAIQIPQQKSQLPLILAVVVVLMGMYLFTQQTKSNQTEPPITSEVVTVSVDLDSDPTEAEIYEDGSLLGTTPQNLTLQKDESLKLVLKKNGFEDREITVTAKVLKPIIPLIPIKVEPASENTLPSKPNDNLPKKSSTKTEKENSIQETNTSQPRKNKSTTKDKNGMKMWE